MHDDTQPRQVTRRTIVKGAAWSIPVIAVAVSAPLASASDKQANLKISSGCLQVAGVGVLPGFSVTNSGIDTYSQPVIVTETVDLSAVGTVVRTAFWLALTAGGLLQGADSGVSVGGWTTSGGFVPTTATRTITIAGGLPVGSSKSWGQALNLAGAGSLVGGAWNAVITTPTGNPPVTQSSASQDFQIIGGCNTTPPGPPGLTEMHKHLGFNYEKSKWCDDGLVLANDSPGFEPKQIDGTIADGFVFTLNDSAGRPLVDTEITFALDGTSSGSFWFAEEPYQGDDRGPQAQTLTLRTDANGKVALDNSVPGMPIPGNAAYDNWGWLRYGSGAKSGVTLTATAVGYPPVVITGLANGAYSNPKKGEPAMGPRDHAGNKTRNYDGGTAC